MGEGGGTDEVVGSGGVAVAHNFEVEMTMTILSRSSGESEAAACAIHVAPAMKDFALLLHMLNSGAVVPRGSIVLRPSGRSTDVASIVDSW